MDKINKLRKKFFSTDLPIRLCIFNMMSCVGILGGLISLITTYMMSINNGQVISMSVAVILLIVLLYIANVMKKLKLASFILCGLIGFILFPIMFLKGGGIYSGMPIWFMLFMVFAAILIEGKLKYAMCSIALVIYVSLVYIAYAYPDILHYFDSNEAVFIDIGQSMIFVGLCIVSIISFQVYMYDEARKKTEEALREAEIAKVEADAANIAKSSFLANMSHEIRTPLGVIIGMNEMIQRESTEESVVGYSKDVTASASSLLTIINDILDFSKIESGKMNIVEDEYELLTLLNDITDMARVRKEETGIGFVANIDNKLPCKLFGDDLRIKQCLINLISNAFKYTEKGKITFDVTGQVEADYLSITFSVEDTGKGIKPEEKEKLFESFVRLDESKNRSIQGTGLGLNITSSLLYLMGSKLEVESEYGKGSRFYFTIKQKIIDGKYIEIDKKKNSSGDNEYQPSLIREDANVLVVDDSKMNLKVFCALLKKTQINIDTAMSGMEAIEILKNKKYDIVFLDHMMPEMDGEETLIKLKEDNIIGDTPVVMLTANAIVGMKEHFLSVGFNDYLSKPIEYKCLEEILQKYL